MTFYRCSQCQFSTSDPTLPECPHCHDYLAEEEESSEDLLEQDDTSSMLY